MRITKVENTGAKFVSHCVSSRAIFISVVSMSRENLFKILPTGVVSKKDVGARSTFCNSLR